jgi:hypothetical protein
MDLTSSPFLVQIRKHIDAYPDATVSEQSPAPHTPYDTPENTPPAPLKPRALFKDDSESSWALEIIDDELPKPRPNAAALTPESRAVMVEKRLGIEQAPPAPQKRRNKRYMSYHPPRNPIME